MAYGCAVLFIRSLDWKNKALGIVVGIYAFNGMVAGGGLAIAGLLGLAAVIARAFL